MGNNCCGRCLREHFSLHALGLNHDRKGDFFSSQWTCCPRFLYPAYRGFLVFYMLGMLCCDLSLRMSGTSPFSSSHSWLAYLTNWTYCLLSLYQLYSFIIVIVMMIATSQNQVPNRSAEESPEPSTFTSQDPITADESAVLPWYLKIRWLLYNMSALMAVMVTALYIGAVFDIKRLTSALAAFIDLSFHGVTTVFVLLDLFITAIPIRIVHFVYGICFFLVYVAFSVTYWLFDKKNNIVYSVLDWNKPIVAVIAIAVSVVASIIIWLMLYAGYRLRRKIAQLTTNSAADQSEEPGIVMT